MCTTESPTLNLSKALVRKVVSTSECLSHHHILPFLLWPKTCTLSFLPSCSKLHLKSLLLSPCFTLNCSQHWIPSCLLQSPCPLPTVNRFHLSSLLCCKWGWAGGHMRNEVTWVSKWTEPWGRKADRWRCSPESCKLSSKGRREGEGTKQHPAEGQVKVLELRVAPSFVFWATFAVAW